MSRIYRNLGTVAMEPKGEYNSSTYYEKLNIVNYEGVTYVAKEAVQGEAPSSSTKWQKLMYGSTIIFDNVAEMKDAASLEIGMTVETSGYYSANDGGRAKYVIRTKTQSDVEDNGSIHFIGQTLVAELIIENNTINLKQFGAKGDGTTDDSDYIQNCIDFAEKIVITNNTFSKNEPQINLNGLYKITKTIILSPYLTYNLTGDVTFVSYLTTGTAIQLKYRTLIDNDTLNNKSNGWTRGDIFYGGNLFITNNENTINNNVIGLEIGNNANLGTSGAISRGRIQNISVTYFNIGVKINAIHFYIESFYNLVMHNNNIDMQIGNEGDTNKDSGENILFQNCLFGTANDYGFNTNIATMNYTFNNCSFDYNKKGAIRMFKQCCIKLDSCHIEDCQANDGDINGIIGTTSDNVYSQLEINNVLFVNANNTSPLISGKNITTNIVLLRETTLSSAESSLKNSDNFYLTQDSIINSKLSMLSNLRMTAPKSNEFKKYTLADEEVAPIVNAGTTKWIKYYNAINGAMQISTINDENVIDITASDDSSKFNCEFRIDEDIDINNTYKNISVGFLYKMTAGSIEPSIVATFLDSEKNTLSSKTWTASSNNRLTDVNEWYKPLNIGFIDNSFIPEKTKYIKIRLRFIAREYCSELLIKQLHCEFK